jgi:lactoylglutathione lyase
METPKPGHTVGFVHVGLQVSDLERSRRFYRDIIGLVELERQVRGDPYLGHVTGYRGVELHISMMQEPASGIVVKLLEYRGYTGTAVDTATVNPGTAHVSLQVDDVDIIHARAIAAGHSAVNDPVTPTSGPWLGGRGVYLIDPDGIRIELMQRGPTPSSS